MKKYSVIDIETTGGRKDGNKITEIAIINIDGDEVVEEYSTLINPERKIPLNITYFTGISNQMVEDAPKFYEVAKKIVELTEGRIFVAHNVFFDFNFIKHEFSELGYQFKREKLCTVRLARKYLPGYKSYSLGNICSDLGIEITARHRALGDAKATVILFQKILQNITDQDFVEDKSKVLMPSNVDKEEYEKLPEDVGVYYFFDINNKLLYVGKSKNIKKRVAQHFRADLKRKKDIQLKSRISRIEYKLMGNELAALLFECHEIKTKWPSFNVSLKAKKFTYGVKLVENEQGVRLPKIFSSIDPQEFIYIFKNKFVAQKKIDHMYKNICGELNIGQTYEAKIENMIKLLGIDNVNSLIEKTFYYNVPKENDFFVEAKGIRREKCIISIINKKPTRIEFGKKEGIDLIDDPQMSSIFWNYHYKKKLKIIKYAH